MLLISRLVPGEVLERYLPLPTTPLQEAATLLSASCWYITTPRHRFDAGLRCPRQHFRTAQRDRHRRHQVVPGHQRRPAEVFAYTTLVSLVLTTLFYSGEQTDGFRPSVINK